MASCSNGLWPYEVGLAPCDSPVARPPWWVSQSPQGLVGLTFCLPPWDAWPSGPQGSRRPPAKVNKVNLQVLPCAQLLEGLTSAVASPPHRWPWCPHNPVFSFSSAPKMSCLSLVTSTGSPDPTFSQGHIDKPRGPPKKAPGDVVPPTRLTLSRTVTEALHAAAWAGPGGHRQALGRVASLCFSAWPWLGRAGWQS